jgi:hypothetical protein
MKGIHLNVASYLQNAILYLKAAPDAHLRMESHEIKLAKWMKGEIDEWNQNTLEIPVSICIWVQIL